MRWAIALLWLAGLGCGIAAAEDEPEPSVTPAWAGHVPLPRPRPPLWAEPQSFREAAGPDFNSADVTSEPSDCRKRLEVIAAIEPMPRLIGPGACGGSDVVQLNAVQRAGQARIELRPAPVLRCAMAESLAAWIQDEAVPRLGKTGMALRAVETYDDFECRGRNRVEGAKLSEHGKGNAVDVRAFTLADNRVIGLTDMAVPKEVRESIRESACGRFTTVLGPGSDGHHENHIHLDIAERRQGYRICQWDVREPPPPAELASALVPLPIPRPAIADAPVKDGRKL
jgi:hypothetical protein